MENKSLIKFLHESGAVEKVGNVYQAEKAFMIKRVMNVLRDNKDLSQREQIKILTLVNRYANNELSIFFQGGSLVVEFTDEKEENEDDILAGSV
tara:strand:+ start:450 stop:731 length:282 start_codon:yes stop_codon:yes gene_type:complete